MHDFVSSSICDVSTKRRKPMICKTKGVSVIFVIDSMLVMASSGPLSCKGQTESADEPETNNDLPVFDMDLRVVKGTADRITHIEGGAGCGFLAPPEESRDFRWNQGRVR